MARNTPGLDNIEQSNLDDYHSDPTGHRDRYPKYAGVATVGAEDTIGSPECWCGEHFGHAWPGKADGAPHPGIAREGAPFSSDPI